jgi:hypothetical protein
VTELMRTRGLHLYISISVCISSHVSVRRRGCFLSPTATLLGCSRSTVFVFVRVCMWKCMSKSKCAYVRVYVYVCLGNDKGESVSSFGSVLFVGHFPPKNLLSSVCERKQVCVCAHAPLSHAFAGR